MKGSAAGAIRCPGCGCRLNSCIRATRGKEGLLSGHICFQCHRFFLLLNTDHLAQGAAQEASEWDGEQLI
ncbi:hypothetical protein [Gloeobacter kilaueensis]|uniref:Uncharacterized protein n=1 Tax=Gloeobacter kilaueensis (strain ATCC BAA-2537 / CCAP 1431/1 / ULC 316 / JS1) TaxID=1183438 RepID=U5QHL2_GLOK1|nr:hypothetical protein [Gloeobacter kilaueensis]AGY57124.1 hypothetical protein GKIL_0878 [Gloeobacter kilaueensis JS1]